MELQYLLIDILTAYILDLIIGDPYWLPHPIRLIGRMIRKSEMLLRKHFHSDNADEKPRKERTAGIILMVSVVFLTFSSVFLVLKVAGIIHPMVFHVLNTYFIYSALATKCLAVEANKVYSALKEDSLIEARRRLSMLVGRQTENLRKDEIIRGVVETVAENTVDGIISPLFYVFIGTLFGIGAPLVYAFKAVSTLDSMVGYMNEKYINFGRASAKMDDVANYIPARLSGGIIPLSALICRKNFKKSFLIMLRDRRNHKSPNCAYPEAAVAGALGIKLGGANMYFGKMLEKPEIGDGEKILEPKDVRDTIKIMYVASALMVAVVLALIVVFF